MKLYELVKSILEIDELARNDDKHLIWEVLKDQGLVGRTEVGNEYLTKRKFMESAISFESITRERRMVQADFPELDANKEVKKFRRNRETTKGTFVYREEVGIIPKNIYKKLSKATGDTIVQSDMGLDEGFSG